MCCKSKRIITVTALPSEDTPNESKKYEISGDVWCSKWECLLRILIIIGALIAIVLLFRFLNPVCIDFDKIVDRGGSALARHIYVPLVLGSRIVSTLCVTMIIMRLLSVIERDRRDARRVSKQLVEMDKLVERLQKSVEK